MPTTAGLWRRPSGPRWHRVLTLKGLFGSIFGTTFRSASFFAKEVPSDEAFVGAQNLGNIRTFASGLGVPVETPVPVLKPAKPPSMRGHKESREFHVSSGCEFGGLISPSNLRKFTRHEQALRDGYDGGATCQPKFSIASFGDLGVHREAAGGPRCPRSSASPRFRWLAIHSSCVHASLGHLVRPEEQGRWNGEAEGLGGPRVDP
jgi:hypothetical protein